MKEKGNFKPGDVILMVVNGNPEKLIRIKHITDEHAVSEDEKHIFSRDYEKDFDNYISMIVKGDDSPCMLINSVQYKLVSNEFDMRKFTEIVEKKEILERIYSFNLMNLESRTIEELKEIEKLLFKEVATHG